MCSAFIIKKMIKEDFLFFHEVLPVCNLKEKKKKSYSYHLPSSVPPESWIKLCSQ